MNGTKTLKPPTTTAVGTVPHGGFAGRAVRLERRLGWVLWATLALLLVVIST